MREEVQRGEITRSLRLGTRDYTDHIFRWLISRCRSHFPVEVPRSPAIHVVSGYLNSQMARRKVMRSEQQGLPLDGRKAWLPGRPGSDMANVRQRSTPCSTTWSIVKSPSDLPAALWTLLLHRTRPAAPRPRAERGARSADRPPRSLSSSSGAPPSICLQCTVFAHSTDVHTACCRTTDTAQQLR